MDEHGAGVGLVGFSDDWCVLVERCFVSVAVVFGAARFDLHHDHDEHVHHVHHVHVHDDDRTRNDHDHRTGDDNHMARYDDKHPHLVIHDDDGARIYLDRPGDQFDNDDPVYVLTESEYDALVSRAAHVLTWHEHDDDDGRGEWHKHDDQPRHFHCVHIPAIEPDGRWVYPPGHGDG